MPFRFQFRRYRLPFRATVRTAHGPWNEREGIVVRVEDLSGGGTTAAGFGEGAPIPWFGTETLDEIEEGCHALGEWIEETAVEAIPRRLGCLRFALASALAEVRSKISQSAAGRGDAQAMHTTEDRSALAVAALLPAGRAALTQIAPKADLGFRVFKWKVGIAELADELALLDDVCAALPSGAHLRLDANGAWDRRQAERWLERCAERPIEYVEQPCFADATQGETAQRRIADVLLGLAGDYPTPIALDESMVGEHDLDRWIDAGWPGIFVIKPCLIGDITAALARLQQARADVVFSSSLETCVGARSALRAAFTWAEQAGAVSPEGSERTREVAANPGRGGTGAATRNETASPRRSRALGFGVWPLFADMRFDGPGLAPFLRLRDVEKINSETAWNALS